MLMTTFGGYAVAIGYFHGVNMVRVLFIALIIFCNQKELLATEETGRNVGSVHCGLSATGVESIDFMFLKFFFFDFTPFHCRC